MLVTAIFTVDDAVETVNFHVATDQAVTIIRDLIDGSDARIADLDFVQDDEDSTLLVADVGESSSLEVVTTVESSVPSIRVAFVTYIDSEVQEDIDPSVDGDDAEVEVMDLGVFADYDTVFNVLSVAVDQADSWEAELIASATDPWGSEVRDPWGDTV